MLVVKPSGRAPDLMLLVFVLTVITLPADIASGSPFAIGFDIVIIFWCLLWFDRYVHIVLDQRTVDAVTEEVRERGWDQC